MAGQSVKYIVFIVIIFAIFAALVVAISSLDVLVANALWLLLVALFLLIVWKGDLVLMLEEFQRAVIMRFGRVVRVGGPGWCIVLPFIEKPTIVDLRTQTVDVPKQDVITKGNIELKVDAVLYLRVKADKESVVKSVVEVENYKEATRLYLISSIRAVVGTMTLTEVISSTEEIESSLQEEVAKITKDWGVEVVSVDFKDVDIPKTVLDAMHREKAAEQDKLSRMEGAMAHEYEIETVKRAAEHLSDKAMAYYYIRALEKLGEGKSTKFMFPMELSRLAESIGKGAQSGQNLDALFEKYAPAVTSLLSKGEKEAIKKKARKK
jgi:regulator of protease activity HflC (stomatin/prohibitin superfamily)